VNPHKLIAPFKREVWEHQSSFVMVFVVLGGVILGLALIAAFSTQDLSEASIHIQFDDHDFTGKDFEGTATDEIKEHINIGLNGFVAVLMHLFIYLSSVVSIYYLLGSLFDDRKDRSILFWKSLPVSETQSVLTKFVTGVLVIPFIAMVIGLITSFLLAILVSIWLPLLTNYGFIEVWSQMAFFSAIAISLGFVAVTGIWVAPFCAWLMLASSVAKRSPLMWAVVPPVLIIMAESLIFRESQLKNALIAYMPDFQALEHYDNKFSWQAISELIVPFFSGPQFVVAIVASGLMLAACIWLRNNRYEI